MNDDQTMAATPHAELIAELMNPNIPKNEREHAAVREIERLREALENPVLEDIEQYCLQMAGICTAAIGYWKDGDNIHPDYNTLALRDVANLYAKYDELYKAQPITQAIPQIPQEHSSNRQWVGLTDDEINAIVGPWGSTEIKGYTRKLFDQIEAKLKEKNT